MHKPFTEFGKLQESTKKSLKVETSSDYYDKIDTIETYMGREGAIDAWARGISVEDGKEFLGLLVNEQEIPIDEIHDRASLFDAIDEIKEYMYVNDYENLFKELFYYIGDDVARYLINGIYRDLDADGAFEEKKKTPVAKRTLDEGIIRDLIDEIPGANALVSQINNSLKWDGVLIGSLFLELLVDANYHSEAKALEPILLQHLTEPA